MTAYPEQGVSGLSSMSSFPDNKYLGQLMASASSSTEAKYHSSGAEAQSRAGEERGKEDKYLGHIEAKYSLHQQSEAGSDKQQQQQYLGMMCRAVH